MANEEKRHALLAVSAERSDRFGTTMVARAK